MKDISAYINVTLKRLNKPTKSQLRTDATQYKRSSIINAADELTKKKINLLVLIPYITTY